MRTKVQRWGNSLAVRIPRAFASEARLGPGADVEITLKDGQLIVTHIEEPELTLDALLREVRDDNIHGEIDSGPSTGNEAW